MLWDVSYSKRSGTKLAYCCNGSYLSRSEVNDDDSLYNRSYSAVPRQVPVSNFDTCRQMYHFFSNDLLNSIIGSY